MLKTLDFTNRTILVDGSANGIGREIAIYLSRLGAKIILVDLLEENLIKVFNELEGEGHDYLICDIGEIESIEGVIKTIVNRHGPLDGFVHCVGVRCRRPINLLNPNIIGDVMRINYGSFVEFVRNIVKKGRSNKGLSIVAISSISAKTGGACVTGYAASKAAIDAAIRCLAKELAPKDIRLNSVMPGQVNTPAYAAMLENTGGKDMVLERQYLGLGDPQDVAYMVAFLLSEQARMITGASIPLDGGYFTS